MQRGSTRGTRYRDAHQKNVLQTVSRLSHDMLSLDDLAIKEGNVFMKDIGYEMRSDFFSCRYYFVAAIRSFAERRDFIPEMCFAIYSEDVVEEVRNGCTLTYLNDVLDNYDGSTMSFRHVEVKKHFHPKASNDVEKLHPVPTVVLGGERDGCDGDETEKKRYNRAPEDICKDGYNECAGSETDDAIVLLGKLLKANDVVVDMEKISMCRWYYGRTIGTETNSEIK